MAWASMAMSIDCSSIADHNDPQVCQNSQKDPESLPVNSSAPITCQDDTDRLTALMARRLPRQECRMIFASKQCPDICRNLAIVEPIGPTVHSKVYRGPR